MSLASDLLALPRPVVQVRVRKKAAPGAYAIRYPNDLVARVKAAFALGLPTELIAKEAGVGQHSAAMWRCGRVKPNVAMDQEAYDAMLRAIRKALKGESD